MNLANKEEENSYNSNPDYIMQTLLLDLNSENFDNKLNELKSLFDEWKNDDLLKDLFIHIIGAVKIRLNQVKLLCNFTCSFYKSFPLQKEQFDKLLKCLIYIFPDNDACLSESYRLFFLQLLLAENFFDLETVINLFSKLFHNFSGISHYLSLIFIWFAPEIEHVDSSFFDEFHNFFNSIWEFEYTSLVIYNVYTNFDKYREDNWKYLRDHRSFDFHQSLATFFISNDMIDKLQNFFNHSKFDLNSRNPPSTYEWRTFLQKCPTYLQIAAFFGSIRCFKFLLLNGAKLESNDFEGKTIAQFAVAGGNNEIIRILHQMNVSFSGTLQVAALFHRNDVFQWIFENEISQLDEFHEVTGLVLHQAIISMNYSIIYLCLSENINVNCCNSDGISIEKFKLDITSLCIIL